MRTILLSVSMLAFCSLQAQTSDNFFDQLKPDAIILSSQGIARGEDQVSEFLNDFANSNGVQSSYEKNFSISVSPNLEYEIGQIRLKESTAGIMVVRSKNTSESIEFLVIFEKGHSDEEAEALIEFRNQWMKLCNAHKVNDLVKQVYTSNAYYYNRGRLIQGTKAITSEYGYMNNPSYSLKLTPKHISMVNAKIAFEIGQCSGSYPLPYLLLWEKQSDGKWKILFDSNY